MQRIPGTEVFLFLFQHVALHPHRGSQKAECPPWARAGELLAAGRQGVSRGPSFSRDPEAPLWSLTSHPSPSPRDLSPRHTLNLITSLSTAPTWPGPRSRFVGGLHQPPSFLLQLPRPQESVMSTSPLQPPTGWPFTLSPLLWPPAGCLLPGLFLLQTCQACSW